MKMDRKPARLSFDTISASQNSAVIKNFILSDSSKAGLNFSFNNPYSFDGIILGISLKGNAVLKIDFRQHKLKENTIFTILPNQIFEVNNTSEDFFIEFLVFAIDFFVDLPIPLDYDILNKITKYPCLHVEEKDMQYFLEYHSFIVNTFSRKKHALTDTTIKSLLFALIIEISANYTKENTNEKVLISSRKEEINEHFFKLLLRHYRQERNASFYADKLCISIKYLSAIMKKTTGRSVSFWIDEAVIIGAKILLKSTDLTMLQISEKLNFPNPSFFGRYFKKHVGQTPLKYRESKQ